MLNFTFSLLLPWEGRAQSSMLACERLVIDKRLQVWQKHKSHRKTRRIFCIESSWEKDISCSIRSWTSQGTCQIDLHIHLQGGKCAPLNSWNTWKWQQGKEVFARKDNLKLVALIIHFHPLPPIMRALQKHAFRSRGNCVRDTKWSAHKTKYPILKAWRQNCSLTTNNMNLWVRFQNSKFKADGVLLQGTHRSDSRVAMYLFYSEKSTTFTVQSFPLGSNVSLLVWLKDLKI